MNKEIPVENEIKRILIAVTPTGVFKHEYSIPVGKSAGKRNRIIY